MDNFNPIGETVIVYGSSYIFLGWVGKKAIVVDKKNGKVEKFNPDSVIFIRFITAGSVDYLGKPTYTLSDTIETVKAWVKYFLEDAQKDDLEYGKAFVQELNEQFIKMSLLGYTLSKPEGRLATFTYALFKKGDYVRTPAGVGIVSVDEQPAGSDNDFLRSDISVQHKNGNSDNVQNHARDIGRAYVEVISEEEYQSTDNT